MACRTIDYISARVGRRSETNRSRKDGHMGTKGQDFKDRLEVARRSQVAPMHRMYGTLDAELEVQRTIKRAD